MRPNKAKKIIFTELMHLDAPLTIAEIINYGETIRNVPWASDPFLHHPYCVFERKNGVVYAWYDQGGINWKIEKVGQFDEKILIEKIVELWRKVEVFIKDEKALSKEDFRKLVSILKNLWVWADGLWWMIEHRDKNKLDVTNLMKVRKQTEHFAPWLIATIRNTYKNLVPKYSEYVDVLLIHEVLENKIPDEKILKSRMKTWSYTDGKLFDSIEEVKKKYGIEIKEENTFSGNELRGQVAFPGKVKGEVKIIKNREDMKKFKKGNIIVSPTTTPDFMPVMKIAGAIISEHGGVICHASITSRELKIPCVVGVKGATRFLKDGDIVEVDADKGVVRLI